MGVPIITCETSSDASDGFARRFDTDKVVKAQVLSPSEASGKSLMESMNETFFSVRNPMICWEFFLFIRRASRK